MYKNAIRKGFRFPSTKGELTTEQLWDLPLESKSGFDLDSVAKKIAAEMKELGDESFVKTASNPRKGVLSNMLDVVKDVIATKQTENAEKLSAASRDASRRKIEEVLARKEDQALDNKSPEELRAMLGELK